MFGFIDDGRGLRYEVPVLQMRIMDLTGADRYRTVYSNLYIVPHVMTNLSSAMRFGTVRIAKNQSGLLITILPLSSLSMRISSHGYGKNTSASQCEMESKSS
jgi:hypothetical protein